MRKISFLIVFLVSSICFAGSKYTCVKDRGCFNYSGCRQDFALKLCKEHPEIYQCVKFYIEGKKHITWEEAYKHEGTRILIQKINRRNDLIYRNHCLASPYNLTDHFNDELYYAPFQRELFVAPPGSGGHRKSIVVDLRLLAWGAYEGPHLVAWGPANGGKHEHKTPLGAWKIIRKGPPVMKSKLYPVNCKNKSICGHTMYWFIQFHPRGLGLYGDENLPGYNGSNGSIKLLKTDAEWLSHFVEIGTEVLVDVY